MSKTIIAVDPGTTHSAVVAWDGEKVRAVQNAIPNAEIKTFLMTLEYSANELQPSVFIEMVACYGMPVGREIFETVLFIGRLQEWLENRGQYVKLVYRSEVKMHHCHTNRAKDGNVRQALIDKYGKPGTKKAPGVTYGISKHAWSAFAIATMITEKRSKL